MSEVFTVFQNQRFLEKNGQFNIVASQYSSNRSLPSEPSKVLKRYIDDFNKQLPLVSFYCSFPAGTRRPGDVP